MQARPFAKAEWTVNSPFTTACLGILRSYSGTEENNLGLVLTLNDCCSVTIRVPGNWHVFTTVVVSCGHVIAICDLPSCLPTSNGGSWAHLTTP